MFYKFTTKGFLRNVTAFFYLVILFFFSGCFINLLINILKIAEINTTRIWVRNYALLLRCVLLNRVRSMGFSVTHPRSIICTWIKIYISLRQVLRYRTFDLRKFRTVSVENIFFKQFTEALVGILAFLEAQILILDRKT